MATNGLTQLKRVLGPAILLVALVLAACAPSQPAATPTAASTATSQPIPTVIPSPTASPTVKPTATAFPPSGKIEVSIPGHTYNLEWGKSSGTFVCSVSITQAGENLQTFGSTQPCSKKEIIRLLTEVKKSLSLPVFKSPDWLGDWLDKAIAELSR